MKINCTSCGRKINLDANVVIDEVNSLYHADCYGEMENWGTVIEWKDFGVFKYIIKKHNI